MPIRTCLGCRQTDEQRNLIRMVADNDGKIRIDLSRTSSLRPAGYSESGDRPGWRPGRGAYVHSNRECIGMLERKGLLGRTLRRKVVADADLQLRIEQSIHGV